MPPSLYIINTCRNQHQVEWGETKLHYIHGYFEWLRRARHRKERSGHGVHELVLYKMERERARQVVRQRPEIARHRRTGSLSEKRAAGCGKVRSTLHWFQS